MTKANNTINDNDPFDLNRFLKAQEITYSKAIAELKSGRKRSHWMWYIFPQIDGLAKSTTSKRYAIKSREEAKEYLKHPVLGARLTECAEAVVAVEGRSISQIFGYPDDLKLKSSMTLFASLVETPSVFERILDKYFQGERDAKTLHLLEELEK
ncbi:MAG: DUF1810 domain-containing protein [Cyanobacteriota bacterium]|nr:DUF1810 domain-containing protein [Cyanobacteriota bacterium]